MPIYGAYLYDAVYQYAIALNKTLALKQLVSGQSVAEKMQDMQYDSMWLFRLFFAFVFDNRLIMYMKQLHFDLLRAVQSFL